MSFTIRPAVEADLVSLLELYAELHPDDPPLPPEVAGRTWTAMTRQDGRVVLVAETDGTLVGTVDCTVSPNLTRGASPHMLVENVVVSAAHRRRGIGTGLLEAAVTLARSAGCYKVQLLSARAEDAHSFYESCGFRPLARGFRRYLREPS
ncbi:GNAT family N-acetyltransferase [Rhizohabitans arisaemae]|uniref:GNAT family N-acetyltransferase n=1 Tax=Rhizohabitans arisaemae TaxID=2720610 RepID=UPI0024B1EB28|nr:GNAT family N-acetyltransferase [Rhizohabitans arisaemae]